jgi:UDP-N-acetylglucosamine 2-epimerase (non-hydrolysing)
MNPRLRILSVVGARPNFMKIAPFVRQLAKFPGRFDHHLVHTGQHYDRAMSDSFWEALDIPPPDANLGIGSGTHAEQVGRTMPAFERVVKSWKPDWIVVVGDVNATCAASITAKKEHVQLAHIEAGLRSRDRTMPEEINRIVTDRLSDLLFTPDEEADQNLRKEGVPESAIHRVGNIMIDTLEANRPKAARLKLTDVISRNLVPGRTDLDTSCLSKGYAVLTLHRPSNVDDPGILESLVRFFVDELTQTMPLLWTLHPRTRKQLETLGLWKTIVSCPALFLLEPLGYLEMLKLNLDARIMLTDSGGLQEECCVLGTPCITLRENTERPITLRQNGGTAELAGHDIAEIRRLFSAMKDASRHESRPPLWDGRTAERIVEVFLKLA